MTQRRRRTKDYTGTTITAMLLSAFGIAASLMSTCSLMLGLVMLASGEPDKQIIGTSIAAASLGSLLGGLLVLGAGIALGILRDIAKNTA